MFVFTIPFYAAGKRLFNFYVFACFGHDGCASMWYQSVFFGPVQNRYTLDVDGFGNFVKIMVENEFNILELCEVEVYGIKGEFNILELCEVEVYGIKGEFNS